MNGAKRTQVLVGVGLIALGVAIGLGAGLMTGAALQPNIHPTYIVHTDAPSVGIPNSDAPDWTIASCDEWIGNPRYTPPAYTYTDRCVDHEGYAHWVVNNNGNVTLPDTGKLPPALPLTPPANITPAQVTDDGTPNSQPTETPCQEDQPCWDCTKMGNHICGPDKAPDSIASGTIWPCVAWADGSYSIPANVRTDVCVTENGSFSYPFDGENGTDGAN